MSVSIPHAGGSLRGERGWFVRTGSRFIATAKAVHEAFLEAQEMARAAHRKYPFVDWS